MELLLLIDRTMPAVFKFAVSVISKSKWRWHNNRVNKQRKMTQCRKDLLAVMNRR